MSGLLARFDALASSRSMTQTTLGYIDEWPLRLYRAWHGVKKRNVLVTAAFHGEEPAGLYGLLDFLRNAPDELFNSVNLSIIPIVNPTGLVVGTRENAWRENPNRGFMHVDTEHRIDPSREGEILLKHVDNIAEFARHVFVTLHEDTRVDKGYAFTYEPRSRGPWTDAVRETMSQHFSLLPDGSQAAEVSTTKGGVIFCEHDSSFENMLFNMGCENIAATETPGQHHLRDRRYANEDIISRSVVFATSEDD